MSDRFCFSWLDENIEIRCGNPSVAELLRLNFAVMAVGTTSAGIRYTVVERGGVPLGLYRDGSDRSLLVADTGELIFALESDLVVQLQLRRPERLFLHAAVLVKDGSAHLLAGRSGAGKSTTCWGLVRSGFEYSSDELAPIDINHMQVAAYPHAICLKSQPPADFPLPAPAVETARGYHIPAAGVYGVSSVVDPPLRSVFFIEYDVDCRSTSMDRVSPPEAATRLYPNVLNALAHDNAGLAAVSRIASACSAWRVRFSSLAEAVAGIRRIVADANA